MTRDASGAGTRLVDPCREFAATYVEGLRETRDSNQIPEERLLEIERDFEAHLAKLEGRRRGDAVTEGIPQYMFWLMEGDRYLGHIFVRTELNDKLRRIGGNVGYEIRPAARGRGLGSLMLKLALEKARGLGLRRVLITCDADNRPSVGVIERNGGRNPELAQIEDWPTPILRYWIEL